MLEKLQAIVRRLDQVERQLSDPAIYADREMLTRLSREQKELTPIAAAFRAWQQAEDDCAQAQELLTDPEMRELAQEELRRARQERDRLSQELKTLLLPRDPNDDRNVILEVRAGIGGEEGALFAADLLRMYALYAERRGWHMEPVYENTTELGGVKEASVTIEGQGAWSRLKFEAGTHRVQRVPETESSGRIQTSAATVAVMPEAEEVEFTIDPKDLQIDTFRSSGAGGQHVNKTESAIRITHLPTGTVVECQDERSQYKNKDRAMKILRSKLYEAQQEKQNAAIAAMEQNIRQYEAENKTGNPVLDTLLTAKTMECQQENITITSVADGRMLGFLTIRELCTIVGVALDNAIAAVRAEPDPEKRLIKVAVYSQGGFAMLRFEHYTETAPALDADGLPQQGSDLKSVRTTVGQHGGSMTLHWENNWCTLRILFPLPQNK